MKILGTSGLGVDKIMRRLASVVEKEYSAVRASKTIYQAASRAIFSEDSVQFCASFLHEATRWDSSGTHGQGYSYEALMEIHDQYLMHNDNFELERFSWNAGMLLMIRSMQYCYYNHSSVRFRCVAAPDISGKYVELNTWFYGLKLTNYGIELSQNSELFDFIMSKG